MTQLTKAQILQLIDAWVTSLQEHELNDQCRKSGRTFFDFMTRRGVKANYLARIIIDATGYNPAQLWKVEDAELLRQSISNYEASVAFTEDDERQGRPQTAEGHFRFFWRR